jgi:hypothetical protein
MASTAQLLDMMPSRLDATVMLGSDVEFSVQWNNPDETPIDLTGFLISLEIGVLNSTAVVALDSTGDQILIALGQ